MKPHMHFFRKQTISLLKNDQVFYGVPGPRNLQKKNEDVSNNFLLIWKKFLSIIIEYLRSFDVYKLVSL